MQAPTLKAHSYHLIQEAKVQLETQDKREERKLHVSITDEHRC